MSGGGFPRMGLPAQTPLGMSEDQLFRLLRGLALLLFMIISPNVTLEDGGKPDAAERRGA